MRIASVDPGIKGSGVAIFMNNVLVDVAYVKNDSGDTDIACRCWSMASVLNYWIERCDLLVFEWPRIYMSGKSKGDRNDLLPLVGVTMALAGRLALYPWSPSFKSYKPDEWKGQMAKGDAFTSRVISRLDERELKIYHNARKACKQSSLWHNAVDAIGIGLHHLGRFERKRVIAR